jgi:hypothetical protein
VVTALVPRLTRLDERVLGHLQGAFGRGTRARWIATRERLELDEVRATLRGLEAVGLARQTGGWWRRVGA